MDAKQASKDDDLVEMMRSGDRVKSDHGLRQWMERDKPILEGWLRKSDTLFYEDFVQEVFWIGYQNIRSGRYQRQEKASLTSYASGIAFNLLNSEIRRRKVRRRKIRFESLEKVGEDGKTYELNVPDARQQAELDKIVGGADDDPTLEWFDEVRVSELSQEELELLLYKFVDEKSWSEIAEIVGKAAGALRTQCSRLLKRLREAAGEASI